VCGSRVDKVDDVIIDETKVINAQVSVATSKATRNGGGGLTNKWRKVSRRVAVAQYNYDMSMLI
jgi:hypothetical protein